MYTLCQKEIVLVMGKSIQYRPRTIERLCVSVSVLTFLTLHLSRCTTYSPWFIFSSSGGTCKLQPIRRQSQSAYGHPLKSWKLCHHWRRHCFRARSKVSGHFVNRDTGFWLFTNSVYAVSDIDYISICAHYCCKPFLHNVQRSSYFFPHCVLVHVLCRKWNTINSVMFIHTLITREWLCNDMPCCTFRIFMLCFLEKSDMFAFRLLIFT